MRSDRSVPHLGGLTLWIATAWLVATTGACRAPETLWFPPPSPPDDAQSVVWLIEWPQGQLAYAQATPSPTSVAEFPAVDWVDGPPDFFRVAAAFYNDSLDDLQLPDGRLAPAVAPRPCAVNTPFQVYDAEVIEGELIEWRSQATLTEDQQDFLSLGLNCARPSQCQAYQVDIALLGSTSSVLDMIRLDAERLMVVQEDGRASTVDLEGVQLQGSVRQSVSAAAIRPDGRLFFGNLRGRIESGPTLVQLVTSTITDSDRRIVALAATTDDSDDVYALSITPQPPTVALHYFDGSRWTEFWRDEVGATSAVQSRLLWLEPGRLIGVFGGASLLVVEDEDVERIEIGRSVLGPVELTSLAEGVDDQGRRAIYVGGADSILYRATASDPRTWRALGGGGFISGIRGLGPIPGGLLLGTNGGSVQAFFPGEGFCEAQAAAAADAQLIDSLGDVVIVAGGAITRNNPASVSYLRPRP